MRRKELIAAIAVVAACLVCAGAYWGYGKYQEAQWNARLEDARKQTVVKGVGDVIELTGKDDPDSIVGVGGFTGTLSLTIDSAAIYDDARQAALSVAGWDQAQFAGDAYFAEGEPACNLVVYAVTVKNDDAAPTVGKNGKLMFMMESIVHPNVGTIVYCAGGKTGDELGYFDLAPGEEKQFTVASVVRKEDVDAGTLSVSDSGYVPSYRVDLEPVDARKGAAA